MKRKRAKDVLADSFLELAEHKPIDKITVTDITDNCEYSPSTFYRQFKDKYDLIAYDYMRGSEEMLNRVGTAGYSWKNVLYDGAKYYEEHRAYLVNLLKHTSGQDSFERYMTEFNYRHFREFIMQAMDVKELSKVLEQAIWVWCVGTVRLNCKWILGQIDASAEEISEIYKESLPIALRSYVL